MSAETPKVAWRPLATTTSQSLGWLALAGGLAAWTAVVAVSRLDSSALPLSGSARHALVFGPLVVLGSAALFDARVAALRPVWIVLGWVAVVAVCDACASRIASGDATLAAVPLVPVAAVVFTRRPALGVGLAFAVSGAFGSLSAFFGFPIEKSIQLIVGGMLLGLVWNTLVRGRDYSVKSGIGFLAIALYVYITFVQTILDAGNHAAVKGFMTSNWYSAAGAVVALAGWRTEVHERVAKALLIVAAGVGAYAVYRWVAGISVTEYTHFAGTPYNYVGGKLRLIGSFPSGQDLGGWTAVVTPFCLAAGLTFSGRWRAVALAAAALCAVALVGSQLRIAIIAVALGCLVVVILHEGARGFSGLRLGATATVLIAMVAVGLVAFQITGGSSDPITHSYSSLFHPNRTDPSVDERLYKWDAAIRDLRNHPFGYGMGTANANSRTRLISNPSIGRSDVDNGFLRVALEQGWLIMAVFAIALIALTADLTRFGLTLRRRLPAGLAIGAAGTSVSLLVLMMAVAFQDGPRALPVWIIVGLGLAQFTTRRQAAP